MRPGAIVTGASRGIGKACAVALAEAGYDVVITARTVRRTDQTWDPERRSDRPLPGSLEETADEITAVGGAAHPVRVDLLDTERLPVAAAEAQAALGRVDLLVNNAVVVMSGNDDAALDADPDDIERRVLGNVVAPLRFMAPIVAGMVAQGGGTVLDMTSAAATAQPFARPGQGGWSLGYTIAKAGFHRIAPQLDFEYRDRGLVARNVQPGMVATERVTQVGEATAMIAERGVEPMVVGRALAHVATHLTEFGAGGTIQLQAVARDLGLLPPDAPIT